MLRGARRQGEAYEARVQVYVQPFAIEIDADLADGPTLDRDDRVVLRHPFGSRVSGGYIVRKQFGGSGGARVLLVEPFLAPPPDPGRAGSFLDGGPFQASALARQVGGPLADRRRGRLL